jgi:hypothetical protein
MINKKEIIKDYRKKMTVRFFIIFILSHIAMSFTEKTQTNCVATLPTSLNLSHMTRFLSRGINYSDAMAGDKITVSNKGRTIVINDVIFHGRKETHEMSQFSENRPLYQLSIPNKSITQFLKIKDQLYLYPKMNKTSLINKKRHSYEIHY